MLARLLSYIAAIGIGAVIGLTATGGLVETHTLVNGIEVTPAAQQATMDAMVKGAAKFTQFTTLRLGSGTPLQFDGLWLYWVVLVSPIAIACATTYLFRKLRATRPQLITSHGRQ